MRLPTLVPHIVEQKQVSPIMPDANSLLTESMSKINSAAATVLWHPYNHYY